MPDPHQPPAYPTKKELLRLARDILDQKPKAIQLTKDVVHQFQIPTLEAVLNLARAYLDALADDGPHHH